VAQHAVDVDQRGLAVAVDPGEVALHHRGPPGLVPPGQVGGGQAAPAGVGELVAAGVQAGKAHRRLDHPLAVLGQIPPLARSHPGRGHDRDADDAEHLHQRYIRQINQVLADKPVGMTVTTHMCRGRFRSSWAAEGGTTSSPWRCSASS